MVSVRREQVGAGAFARYRSLLKMCDDDAAVPKLGMGPIRREQICRAATTVIAREGFSGTTMRVVADEAGVSTGMLNHYFANRQDLLMHALEFVSQRAHGRMLAAIDGMPPGRARLAALLDSMLADGEDQEAGETWRVWINAYGEAVRLPELRHTIESRLNSWYALIDHALEGLVPAHAEGDIPWSWRLDALLNGLSIRALTSETALSGEQIRDAVIRTLLQDVPARA
jgi:TetR/AcrR family transcriptional regulator, transcriptional repressor of bet genes